MLLERGSLLNNRYRIIEILGQGGMGSVYRAVDENLSVDVAVKDNLFTTEEYARQFRREAVLLATLRHPNLPRVTDHFVIDGQGQYLVMDYIEGEDLRQRMDRVGLISEEEVIIVGAAICDALTYLSSCNPPIVHRDIKPGNVRISPQGHVYLVDFGLAKDLKTQQTTTTGARAMTPGYSPPEQYGTARTDQRTDIYSLGATLYAALTGTIPEDALSRAVDHIELTSIRKYNGRVTKRLVSVVEKALDIRPDGRFQNADEFKQALLNAGSPSQRNLAEYVVAPPPSVPLKPAPKDHVRIPADIVENFPYSGGEFPPALPPNGGIQLPGTFPNSRPVPRSSQGRLWQLALLVLLLTILAVVLFTVNPAIADSFMGRLFNYSNIVPPFVRTGTVMKTFEATQLTQTPVFVVAGNTATPTLAMILSDTPAPVLTITLTPKPTRTPLPTSTNTAIATPSFTPTLSSTPTLLPTFTGSGSGQIAFASDRRYGLPQIWLMDVNGKNARQLTSIKEGACQPIWSPDGKQMIFISPCDRNKEVYQTAAMFLIPDVDAEKIELIPLPTAPGGDYDPNWSADGSKIAFTSIRESASPRIYEMNLADKTVKVLTSLYHRDSQPAWFPNGTGLAYSEDNIFSQIVTTTLDEGVSNLLRPTADGFSDVHPAWSPDGNAIMFTRYPPKDKPPYLVAVNLTTNDGKLIPQNLRKEVPVYSASVPMREAKYSPDGVWVAFETWGKGGNHDIAIMTSNGSSFQILTTDGPRSDFDPSWRP